MAAQTLAAAAFIVFVVFRAMGRDYFAAVLSAGFAGFASARPQHDSRHATLRSPTSGVHRAPPSVTRQK